MAGLAGVFPIKRRAGQRLNRFIAASADQGQIPQALEALEQCKAIYESRSDRVLLARMLVKQANILAGVEPAKGLAALDHAVPLIPADDPHLTLLAELLRVECLIEVQKPIEALPVFQRCSPLFIANPRVRMRIRGKFTGARLLDALGFAQQAERLFNEVVDRDVEHELYKDAFLDLLYLYGRHVRIGDLGKAARACQRALTDSSLLEVAHDQLRTLWSQLLEAAQHQAVGQDRLKELRQSAPTGSIPQQEPLPCAELNRPALGRGQLPGPWLRRNRLGANPPGETRLDPCC